MAARLKLHHQDEVRAKIQASQLVNRLEDHALNGSEMSPTQIKAAEILLKKSVPDLSSVELFGDPDSPVAIQQITREIVKP